MHGLISSLVTLALGVENDALLCISATTLRRVYDQQLTIRVIGFWFSNGIPFREARIV